MIILFEKKYINKIKKDTTILTKAKSRWMDQELVFISSGQPKPKGVKLLMSKATKLSYVPTFFNFTFDKGRLKNLVSWTLENYGQYKTVELLEQLKKTGFEYATKAGISLGIDDLKIPPKKKTLLLEAEQLTKLTVHQYQRGDITAVERFQRLIDTWHRTSEQLKQEVITHFEETDILNPVYMMAFSGARGNISQVRQLVGMRGLMSDPQGQIIDFPIRSNFREGLTLTEYIISSYGARKGIVDTALRTANAGYLTRRLVDVAQHVIISHYDCGTQKGIFLTDMKEGNKIIVSAQTRIIGRVLARDIYKSNKMIVVASRNQEISTDLAFEITKITNRIFVRSSLTCNTTKLLCQLCYGWSLAQGNLVSVGEAVGVIAAQSIGEPGTQLTMRTFHTGGVFSGDVSDEIRAPYNGFVHYGNTIPGILIRALDGKILFLTKSDGTLIFSTNKIEHTPPSLNTQNKGTTKGNVGPPTDSSCSYYKIPAYTVLFIRNGESVFQKQVVAQITSIRTKPNMRDTAELVIKSELEGLFYAKNLQVQKKVIGPKPKFVGEAKQNLLLDSKAMEIVVKARGWNFAWVLSGKRYELPLLLKSFPIIGDFITPQTVITRHNLKLPSPYALKLNITNTFGFKPPLGQLMYNAQKKEEINFAFGQLKYLLNSKQSTTVPAYTESKEWGTEKQRGCFIPVGDTAAPSRGGKDSGSILGLKRIKKVILFNLFTKYTYSSQGNAFGHVDIPAIQSTKLAQYSYNKIKDTINKNTFQDQTIKTLLTKHKNFSPKVLSDKAFVGNGSCPPTVLPKRGNELPIFAVCSPLWGNNNNFVVVPFGSLCDDEQRAKQNKGQQQTTGGQLPFQTIKMKQDVLFLNLKKIKYHKMGYFHFFNSQYLNGNSNPQNMNVLFLHREYKVVLAQEGQQSPVWANAKQNRGEANNIVHKQRVDNKFLIGKHQLAKSVSLGQKDNFDVKFKYNVYYNDIMLSPTSLNSETSVKKSILLKRFKSSNYLLEWFKSKTNESSCLREPTTYPPQGGGLSPKGAKDYSNETHYCSCDFLFCKASFVKTLERNGSLLPIPKQKQQLITKRIPSLTSWPKALVRSAEEANEEEPTPSGDESALVRCPEEAKEGKRKLNFILAEKRLNIYKKIYKKSKAIFIKKTELSSNFFKVNTSKTDKKRLKQQTSLQNLVFKFWFKNNKSLWNNQIFDTKIDHYLNNLTKNIYYFVSHKYLQKQQRDYNTYVPQNTLVRRALPPLVELKDNQKGSTTRITTLHINKPHLEKSFFTVNKDEFIRTNKKAQTKIYVLNDANKTNTITTNMNRLTKKQKLTIFEYVKLVQKQPGTKQILKHFKSRYNLQPRKTLLPLSVSPLTYSFPKGAKVKGITTTQLSVPVRGLGSSLPLKGKTIGGQLPLQPLKVISDALRVSKDPLFRQKGGDYSLTIWPKASAHSKKLSLFNKKFKLTHHHISYICTYYLSKKSSSFAGCLFFPFGETCCAPLKGKYSMEHEASTSKATYILSLLKFNKFLYVSYNYISSNPQNRSSFNIKNVNNQSKKILSKQSVLVCFVVPPRSVRGPGGKTSSLSPPGIQLCPQFLSFPTVLPLRGNERNPLKGEKLKGQSNQEGNNNNINTMLLGSSLLCPLGNLKGKTVGGQLPITIKFPLNPILTKDSFKKFTSTWVYKQALEKIKKLSKVGNFLSPGHFVLNNILFDQNGINPNFSSSPAVCLPFGSHRSPKGAKQRGSKDPDNLSNGDVPRKGQDPLQESAINIIDLQEINRIFKTEKFKKDLIWIKNKKPRFLPKQLEINVEDEHHNTSITQTNNRNGSCPPPVLPFKGNELPIPLKGKTVGGQLPFLLHLIQFGNNNNVFTLDNLKKLKKEYEMLKLKVGTSQYLFFTKVYECKLVEQKLEAAPIVSLKGNQEKFFINKHGNTNSKHYMQTPSGKVEEPYSAEHSKGNKVEHKLAEGSPLGNGSFKNTKVVTNLVSKKTSGYIFFYNKFIKIAKKIKNFEYQFMDTNLYCNMGLRILDIPEKMSLQKAKNTSLPPSGGERQYALKGKTTGGQMKAKAEQFTLSNRQIYIRIKQAANTLIKIIPKQKKDVSLLPKNPNFALIINNYDINKIKKHKKVERNLVKTTSCLVPKGELGSSPAGGQLPFKPNDGLPPSLTVVSPAGIKSTTSWLSVALSPSVLRLSPPGKEANQRGNIQLCPPLPHTGQSNSFDNNKVVVVPKGQSKDTPQRATEGDLTVLIPLKGISNGPQRGTRGSSPKEARYYKKTKTIISYIKPPFFNLYFKTPSYSFTYTAKTQLAKDWYINSRLTGVPFWGLSLCPKGQRNKPPLSQSYIPTNSVFDQSALKNKDNHGNVNSLPKGLQSELPKKIFIIPKQPCLNVCFYSKYSSQDYSLSHSKIVKPQTYSHVKSPTVRFGAQLLSRISFDYHNGNLVARTNYISPFEGELLYTKPEKNYLELNPYQNLKTGLTHLNNLTNHQTKEEKMRMAMFKYYLKTINKVNHLTEGLSQKAWSRFNLILTKNDLMTLNYDPPCGVYPEGDHVGRIPFCSVSSPEGKDANLTGPYSKNKVSYSQACVNNLFQIDIKNKIKIQTISQLNKENHFNKAYNFNLKNKWLKQNVKNNTFLSVGNVSCPPKGELTSSFKGDNSVVPFRGVTTAGGELPFPIRATVRGLRVTLVDVPRGEQLVDKIDNALLYKIKIALPYSALVNVKKQQTTFVNLIPYNSNLNLKWLIFKQKNIFTKNKVGFFFLKGNTFFNTSTKLTTNKLFFNSKMYEQTTSCLVGSIPSGDTCKLLFPEGIRHLSLPLRGKTEGNETSTTTKLLLHQRGKTKGGTNNEPLGKVHFLQDTRYLDLNICLELQKLHLNYNFLTLKPLSDKLTFTAKTVATDYQLSKAQYDQKISKKRINLVIKYNQLKNNSLLYTTQLTFNQWLSYTLKMKQKIDMYKAQEKNYIGNVSCPPKGELTSSLDNNSVVPFRGVTTTGGQLINNQNKRKFINSIAKIEFYPKELFYCFKPINTNTSVYARQEIAVCNYKKQACFSFKNLYLFFINFLKSFMQQNNQIAPKQYKIKVIKKSGQLIHINKQKITLRLGQPLVISPRSIIHASHGDFIRYKTSVITLTYQQLKTGDIVQGIPKIEQLFEARTTKRGRLFRDNVTNLLTGLFLKYFVKSTYLLRKNGNLGVLPLKFDVALSSPLVSRTLLPLQSEDAPLPLCFALSPEGIQLCPPLSPKANNNEVVVAIANSEPEGQRFRPLGDTEGKQKNRGQPKGQKADGYVPNDDASKVHSYQKGTPSLTSLPNLFANYSQNQTIILALALQWSVKQSFYKIQQIIVDGILRVYRSQGVSIADKHVEIIVKQMTSKVRIINSNASKLTDYSFSLQNITRGLHPEVNKPRLKTNHKLSNKTKRGKTSQAFENKLLEQLLSNNLDGPTGLFPGEIVDIDFVENINIFLLKTSSLESLNTQTQTTFAIEPIKYEPIVLGITRASLEVESFLSAASFQQTTRVLSQAALYKKKDFLKGLKENIIIGNLIPAGTGYLSSLNL